MPSLEDSEVSVSQGSHATEVIQFIRKPIPSFGFSKLSGHFCQNGAVLRILFGLRNPNHTLSLLHDSFMPSVQKINFSLPWSLLLDDSERQYFFFVTGHNSQKTLPEGKPLLNMTLVRSSTPSAVRGQCAATALLHTRGSCTHRKHQYSKDKHLSLDWHVHSDLNYLRCILIKTAH